MNSCVELDMTRDFMLDIGVLLIRFIFVFGAS